MRLCPNCGDHDSSDRVRCQYCGADLLPESISRELFDLRARVNEFTTALEKATRCNLEAMELYEKTRKALQEARDEFEARTTDEAIGRAMRRLGAVSDEDVKNVERAIDKGLDNEAKQRHADDDDVPF